jgi:hypothetical protein
MSRLPMQRAAFVCAQLVLTSVAQLPPCKLTRAELHGSVDRPFIVLQELIGHCSAVYRVNRATVLALEAHLEQYGYQQPPNAVQEPEGLQDCLLDNTDGKCTLSTACSSSMQLLGWLKPRSRTCPLQQNLVLSHAVLVLLVFRGSLQQHTASTSVGPVCIWQSRKATLQHTQATAGQMEGMKASWQKEPISPASSVDPAQLLADDLVMCSARTHQVWSTPTSPVSHCLELAA